MENNFRRTEPIVFLDDFISRVFELRYFPGSNGNLCYVDDIQEDIMYIKRINAKAAEAWPLYLLPVYLAYFKLDDYSVTYIKEYVFEFPVVARILLLHLGMLEDVN